MYFRHDGGAWRPGCITRCRPDGSFDVQPEEGGGFLRRVEAANLRALRRTSRSGAGKRRDGKQPAVPASPTRKCASPRVLYSLILTGDEPSGVVRQPSFAAICAAISGVDLDGNPLPFTGRYGPSEAGGVALSIDVSVGSGGGGGADEGADAGSQLQGEDSVELKISGPKDAYFGVGFW